MAMFQPGHLHMERHALNKDDFNCNLRIDYEVAQDPKEGTGMSFRLHGTVEDKNVDETFFLPKDLPSTLPARHAHRAEVRHAKERQHRLDAHAVRRNVRRRAQATGCETG